VRESKLASASANRPNQQARRSHCISHFPQASPAQICAPEYPSDPQPATPTSVRAGCVPLRCGIPRATPTARACAAPHQNTATPLPVRCRPCPGLNRPPFPPAVPSNTLGAPRDRKMPRPMLPRISFQMLGRSVRDLATPPIPPMARPQPRTPLTQLSLGPPCTAASSIKTEPKSSLFLLL
jgi:hypothetical protein